MRRTIIVKSKVIAIFSLLSILSALGGWSSSASAMYNKLTEEQKLEAILFGSNNSQAEFTEFFGDWAVVLENDQGVAIIISEFLALANAAKDSVFRGLQLTPFDIEDAIATSAEKLVFRVTTFGPTMNYAKDYSAIVKAGGVEIPMTYWDNSEGEAFGDGKTRPRFLADSQFLFPSEGVDVNGKITLVIQDKDGKIVSQFPFDLSQFR